MVWFKKDSKSKSLISSEYGAATFEAAATALLSVWLSALKTIVKDAHTYTEANEPRTPHVAQ